VYKKYEVRNTKYEVRRLYIDQPT